MLATAQPTCFLIADISGYTGYLADTELDHAQDILADLVGAVVTALRPDFRLAKLEGDAAFMYMTVGAGVTSARPRPASATRAPGSPTSTSSSSSTTAPPSTTRSRASRSSSGRT